MIGPIVFFTAWAALGATAERYDSTRRAISHLAGLGAPSRPAMTAALLVLAAGMVLYGISLRPALGWALPVANGVTTVAVAALPLGGGVDTAHGVAALVGYAALAATPVVVGRGRPVPVVVGAATAALLLASVLSDRAGLFQRAGVTVAHLWVVVSALGCLRRSPTSWSTTPRARGPAGRRH